MRHFADCSQYENPRGLETYVIEHKPPYRYRCTPPETWIQTLAAQPPERECVRYIPTPDFTCVRRGVTDIFPKTVSLQDFFEGSAAKHDKLTQSMMAFRYLIEPGVISLLRSQNDTRAPHTLYSKWLPQDVLVRGCTISTASDEILLRDYSSHRTRIKPLKEVLKTGTELETGSVTRIATFKGYQTSLPHYTRYWMITRIHALRNLANSAQRAQLFPAILVYNPEKVIPKGTPYDYSLPSTPEERSQAILAVYIFDHLGSEGN